MLPAFLGPFMFHSVCKPTVLKPDIFTAENLEAMGNKKKNKKIFTMIVLKTKTGI